MKINTQSELKASILSCINSDNKNQDEILNKLYQDDESIITELNNLVSLKILKFDKKDKNYNFVVEPTGDKIILDGNILLPVTIINKPDEKLVCRGLWYSFPPDFDINRIIWNVALNEKTNSSLVNLLQLTQNKVRKSKIVQLPEYEKLIGLMVPYSDDIKFQIETVGKNLTAVSLIFLHKLKISKVSNDFLEFRGFKIKSEISTSELIETLTKDSINFKKYSEIKLNKIYNFSDLIFSKNEIPYLFDGEKIQFISLDKIRGEFRIKHFELNNKGVLNQLDIEVFSGAEDGLTAIREIYEIYAKKYMEDINFQIN